MLIRRVPGAVGSRAARAFVAASSQYLEAATGFGLGANDPFYVTLWARRDSSAVNQSYIHLGVAGTLNNSRRLSSSAATTISARSYDNAGAQSNASSAAGSFDTGRWYAVVGEWASVTSRRVIVDGVATSNSTSRSVSAAPNTFSVGVGLDASAALTGAMATIALFAGTASDSLIAQHRMGVHPTRLPGQLLECWDLDRVGPIRGLVRGTVLSPTNGGSLTPGPSWMQGPPVTRRLYVDYGGGAATAYSLTADPGSYSLAGSDAATRMGRRLTGDAGSYAVTGSEASLRVGHVLVTDAGAFLLTGSAATTRAGRVLTADTGSYVSTGSAATFRRGYVLSLDAGAYALTGAVATLVKTGALSLTADPGVYAITGAEATLLVTRLLSADAGSYSVTGIDALLRQHRALTGDPGAYAATGADATLVKVGSSSLTADAGAYSVAGVAAALQQHRVLTADPGTYSLTGADVATLRTWVLAADAGSYSLAGASATVNYSGTVIPDVILVGTITQSVLATLGPITATEGLTVGTLTTLPGDA
jgi:hypothetical protein